MLIVLADQMGRSVGDMYAGALLPGVLLVGLYLLFIALVAFIRPSWVPALPPEARIYREPSGASGHRSLLVLLAICAVAGLSVDARAPPLHGVGHPAHLAVARATRC